MRNVGIKRPMGMSPQVSSGGARPAPAASASAVAPASGARQSLVSQLRRNAAVVKSRNAAAVTSTTPAKIPVGRPGNPFVTPPRPIGPKGGSPSTSSVIMQGDASERRNAELLRGGPQMAERAQQADALRQRNRGLALQSAASGMKGSSMFDREWDRLDRKDRTAPAPRTELPDDASDRAEASRIKRLRKSRLGR